MTSYKVGDIPSTPVTVAPVRGGEYVDLTPFTHANVTLLDGDNALILAPGFTAVIDQEEEVVTVSWPTVSVFHSAGVHNLRVVLTGLGVKETLDSVPVVADVEDGWHTLESARREWTTGMPDDALAYELLRVAREQVEHYAPTDYSPPPTRYRSAQLMQARNLLNAAKTDPAQSEDGSVFVIRPYPLDKWVKTIIRPTRAVKAMF